MIIADVGFTVEFDEDDREAIRRVYSIICNITGKCNELTCYNNTFNFPKGIEDINITERLLLDMLEETSITIHL